MSWIFPTFYGYANDRHLHTIFVGIGFGNMTEFNRLMIWSDKVGFCVNIYSIGYNGKSVYKFWCQFKMLTTL